MLRALIRNGAICAPTVGTWVPMVAPGTPLAAGLRLGRISRLGRWHDLVVPGGVEGSVDSLLPAWSPVEYGSTLMQVKRRTGRKRAAVKKAVKSMISSGRTVKAEMEGTLYQRPAPGARPFVPEGTRVSAHDTIAVVEVMKTFTRIRAPFGGVLRRWLVSDGGSVLQGTPLAVIEPDPVRESKAS